MRQCAGCHRKDGDPQPKAKAKQKKIPDPTKLVQHEDWPCEANKLLCQRCAKLFVKHRATHVEWMKGDGTVPEFFDWRSAAA